MVSRRVYVGLAVLGAVVPYAAFAVFISRHGLDLVRLSQQAFGSPGAAFFALDVVVCGVTVLVGAMRDSRLIGTKWAVAIATLLVGPSCGLPLWLALRQVGEIDER
ncbi:DUF2834 domain-containing protein [Actinoplanes derwentensis]|uniref:DUF2834 domain-containing protein n=1 Tax=Actinoplanes derwentensis TaxID=113562 RepID=A0A1H1VR93_9ACTN|nr:DUF2834 domain-containing protein [Actinoplanes derwentensis]GID83605.1 hypothetical protein Ade03nite_25290 [Actinoplanes derwentensis]SDS87478.1 Protein of unknown function [Actinoplanes derwentensis]